MMRTVPRLVVAAPGSGAGKTTCLVALAEAFRARGLKVAAFKCGPDYLDPTYHARATGAPSHNLDGWLMGREAVLETFARGAAGADLALVEGVMGLHDGAGPDEEGSTAQIARWLEAPVVLLVDAAGMARTFAAVCRGVAAFDPAVRVVGVLANRAGSPAHLELLAAACHGQPPFLGGFVNEPGLAFPERHLGLVTASDEVIPDGRLRAWGARAAERCELDALLSAARAAPPLAPALRAAPGAARRCRIALARDEAFHFYYDDNLRRLEALGAELVPFSPVADEPLPEGTDGVYLGGGYPEAHAARLAAAGRTRAALRAHAARGGPVYGECGGLMYLAQALRTLDGRRHEMAGLVPGTAVMSDRLQALGYVEVETVRPTVLGGPGLRFRGHQFRYSTLEGAAAPEDLAYRLRRPVRGGVSAEGHGAGSVLASYVHAHWASNPLAAAGLVDACARHRAAEGRA